MRLSERRGTAALVLSATAPFGFLGNDDDGLLKLFLVAYMRSTTPAGYSALVLWRHRFLKALVVMPFS